MRNDSETSTYPWAGEFVDPNFVPGSQEELRSWQESVSERQARINALAAVLFVDMLPHHNVLTHDGTVRDAETGLTESERRRTLITTMHTDAFAQQFQDALATANNYAVWDYLVNFFETHPMPGEYCKVSFPARDFSIEEPTA